ncbi:MAG: hypothetical protein HY347_01275 [candidate division NC10 bacterium]|nr:hypothetical protein [candidate division NC10 bacterium]
MEMKVSKETLSLAGEFAVASELCRRGVYCQLTLGNRKRTDLLIETDRQLARVQVKSKQTAEWPQVAGIYRSNEFLVFVDFQGKDEGDRPDFYIASLKDWVALVTAEQHRYPEITVDAQHRITYSDGWSGLNVKPSMITRCRDRWDKILKKVVSPRPKA